MITFDCPHCGTRLTVREEFAGRDGWCRVCKQMITVPSQDAGGAVDLSPGEQHRRFARAFQYAATKADRYQALYAGARKQNEELAAHVDQLRTVVELLNALERRVSAVEAAPPRPAETAVPAVHDPESAGFSSQDRMAMDLLGDRVTQLAADIEGERAERAALVQRMQQMETDLRGLRENHVGIAAQQRAWDGHAELIAAAIDHLKEEAEAIHRADAETRHTLEGMTAALTRLDAQAALQARRLDELAQQTTALGSFEARLEDAAAGLEQVKASMGALQPLIGLDARVESQAVQQDQLAERVAALEPVETTLRSVAAEVAAIQASVAALDPLSGRVLELQEAVACESAERARDMECARAEADTLRGSLTTELEGCRLVLESRQAAQDQIAGALDQIRSEVGALQDSLTQLKSEMDEIRAAVVPETMAETPESLLPFSETEDQQSVVMPEVVEADSAPDRQAMLGTFLRFINPPAQGGSETQ